MGARRQTAWLIPTALPEGGRCPGEVWGGVRGGGEGSGGGGEIPKVLSPLFPP